MKRPGIFLLVFFAASAALAFDTTRKAQPRVAVVTDDEGRAAGPARMLREELREAGVDAFTVRATVDEMCSRDRRAEADYVVELDVRAGNERVLGGAGVAGRHVSVELGVVRASAAAVVRVYDAASGEALLEQEIVSHRGALLPTSIGLGGGSLFGWIGLPLGETQRWRASRAVVRDAASLVRRATGVE